RTGRMQVAVDPVKAAVDLFFPGDVVDLCHRGEAGIPRGLRVRSPESFHQFTQAHVGDHREVRAGVSGVDGRAAIALEQCDRASGHGQQIRRGQSRDATAYDDDVDVEVAIELWKNRQ